MWFFGAKYTPPAFGDAPFAVQTVLVSKKEDKGFRVNMGLLAGKVDTIRVVRIVAAPEKDVTIGLPVSLMLTFDGADHPVILNMKIDGDGLVPVETQAIDVPAKALGFHLQLTGVLGAKLAVHEIKVGLEANKNAPPPPAVKPAPAAQTAAPAATPAPAPVVNQTK